MIPLDDYDYSGKQPALGRFLLPVAECTFALEQVLEDLQKDPWTCQPDERVKRCTGTALTVALVSGWLYYLLLSFSSPLSFSFFTFLSLSSSSLSYFFSFSILFFSYSFSTSNIVIKCSVLYTPMQLQFTRMKYKRNASNCEYFLFILDLFLS
jgi:Sec23/Sec24 trunk domain